MTFFCLATKGFNPSAKAIENKRSKKLDKGLNQKVKELPMTFPIKDKMTFKRDT